MGGNWTSTTEHDMRSGLKWAELVQYRAGVSRIAIIIIAVFAVVGVFGNSMIISFFVKKHRKNIRKMSSYHFLIIVLAVIDLLMCFALTYCYYFEWEFLLWKLDNWSCEYGLTYLKMGFPNLSYWLVVFISYERYRNIVHPFDGKTSRLKYTAFILLVFVSTAGLPFLIGTMVKQRIIVREGVNGEQCNNMNPIADTTPLKFHGTWTVLAIIKFVIPISLMIHYYRKISSYMKSEEKNSQNVGQVFERIRKRNKRALKVIRYLGLIFFFSAVPARAFLWFYLHIISYVPSVIEVYDLEVISVLGYAASWLVTMNNILNFIVYAYIMKDYRKFLFNCLTCGLKRRWKQTDEATTDK